MQLNGPHTEHEEASVSMKVLLLIFGLILVGALGYLVWAQNSAEDTTDNSTPTVKQEATTATAPTPTTTTTDETKDWKTYTNTKLGFSIKYPKSYSVVSATDNSTVPTEIVRVGKNNNTLATISIESSSYGKIGSSEEGGVKTVSNFNDVIAYYKDTLSGYGVKFDAETTVNGKRAFTTIDTTNTPGTSVNYSYVIEGKTGFYTLVSGRSATDMTLPSEKDIILTFTLL